MHQFAISSVREPLTRDLNRFLSITMEQCKLYQKGPNQDHLAAMKVETHALKGLAATLKAKALTSWGDILERSVNWMITHSEEVGECMHLCKVIAHSHPAWTALNEMTLNEDLSRAEDFFPSLLDWYSESCDSQFIHDLNLELAAEEVAATEAAQMVQARSLGNRTQPTLSTASLSFKKQEAPAQEKSKGLPGRKQKSEPLSEPELDAELAASLAMPDDTSYDEFIKFFIQDGEEQVREIEQAALAWEAGSPYEQEVEQISRCLHTLKGASNSVNLRELGDAIHTVEGFLENHPNQQQLAGFCLKLADHLRQYFRKIQTEIVPWVTPWTEAMEKEATISDNKPDREAAPLQQQADESADQLIRIPGSTVNRLSTRVSELLIDRNRLETKVAEMIKLQQNVARTNRELINRITSFESEFEFTMVREKSELERGKKKGIAPAPTPAKNGGGKNGEQAGEFSDIEFDRYDKFNVLARSLAESAENNNESMQQLLAKFDAFEDDIASFRRTARQLQEDLIGLSVLPFSTVSERLIRSLRDAALLYPQKKVHLDLEGETTLIDKDIVDRLFTPLMHLVRNSIAHGIEDEEVRAQKGKEVEGVIRIEVRSEGEEIILDLLDDGAGLNLEAIKAKAIEKELLPPNTPDVTLDQAIELIFQPRFSTADEVNSVSGRGIGMDVVKTEIRSMNGSIAFAPSQVGTHWVIRLPIRMNLGEAILAVVESQTVAFPLSSVRQGFMVIPDNIRVQDDGRFYLIEDQFVPIVDLGVIFGKNPRIRERGFWLAINERHVAVFVDTVIARQEIVLTPLPSLLQDHPLLSGTTLDGYGRIVPVLDPESLFEFEEYQVEETLSGDVVSVGPQRISKVLVVDDSISVRKVQETLLAELGCEVVSAINGADALEKMRSFTPELVLTDLEMPMMDGYELIQELKSKAATKAIPIVVVSSRSTDKYITKAMQFGAASFLSKPFGKEQVQQILERFGYAA